MIHYFFQFSAEVDVDILDLIDQYRNKEDIKLRDLAAGNQTIMHSQEGHTPKVDTEFEGLGALIIAKETVKSNNPLCLGLGPEGNKVRRLAKRFIILCLTHSNQRKQYASSHIHQCTGEINALFPCGSYSHTIAGVGNRSCHRRGSQA